MARNDEQNRRMRDERRRRILSAAVKHFAARGLTATKISDIARSADMSQGLLYHYFRSKEDMFVEIVEMAFTKLNAAAAALAKARLSPREKLEKLVTEVVGSLDTSDDFVWFSALVSAASISDGTPTKAQKIIRARRDVAYRVVADIARAGQADGTVRAGNPDELALVFWTAVKGLALHKAALKGAFRTPSPRILMSIFSK